MPFASSLNRARTSTPGPRRSRRRCSSFRAAADPTRRFRAVAGRRSCSPRREGAIDAARALADLGANLNTVALPQTDIPLKPEEFKTADQGIGTSALVFAIINSHYDLAAMLIEKGADPNVVDIAGMGALYAAVDMNSLQWVQGQAGPDPDRSSGRRGRGQAAPRSRRESECAPVSVPRSSAITTPAPR